jgi:hypothetical protein
MTKQKMSPGGAQAQGEAIRYDRAPYKPPRHPRLGASRHEHPALRANLARTTDPGLRERLQHAIAALMGARS